MYYLLRRIFFSETIDSDYSQLATAGSFALGLFWLLLDGDVDMYFFSAPGAVASDHAGVRFRSSGGK